MRPDESYDEQFARIEQRLTEIIGQLDALCCNLAETDNRHAVIRRGAPPR